MQILRKTEIKADDISLGQLLDMLAAHGAQPLVFHYEGAAIRPGYHITEVKAGRFSALDCGANPEAWDEIFVQLWDVEEGDRGHMSAGKFSAIIRKVSDHVALDGAARLTFEVSDGIQPMRIYSAGAPVLEDNALHIHLAARPASCKPRDRWLAEQAVPAKSACCSGSAAQPCCG